MNGEKKGCGKKETIEMTEPAISQIAVTVVTFIEYVMRV